jgi:hypothetical protein
MNEIKDKHQEEESEKMVKNAIEEVKKREHDDTATILTTQKAIRKRLKEILIARKDYFIRKKNTSLVSRDEMLSLLRKSKEEPQNYLRSDDITAAYKGVLVVKEKKRCVCPLEELD